jgi:hypothetical protein
MPEEDILLLEKYNFKPRKIFKKDSISVNDTNYNVFFYSFDKSYVQDESVQIENINKLMRFYMSPYSGSMYVCRGGYGNLILSNRCIFKRILNKQEIASKDVIFILNGVNLASRLTVIEYYYKNRNKFNKEEQKKIEKIIKPFFSSTDRLNILQLEHDMGFYTTPRKAVKKQLKDDCF